VISAAARPRFSAGNFTVLGSIANLIAEGGGVRRVDWLLAPFRVGAPLTLITLTIGALWLSL
jgi:Na+/H+ antiporter NhaD/arsenite permease-like protein